MLLSQVDPSVLSDHVLSYLQVRRKESEIDKLPNISRINKILAQEDWASHLEEFNDEDVKDCVARSAELLDRNASLRSCC